MQRCASFPQALTAQFDAVSIMHDAVQDGIGERWIAYDFIPAIHRNLAGDQDRATVVTVLDDLEQVAAAISVERFWPPYVDDPLLARRRVVGRSDRLRSYVRPL